VPASPRRSCPSPVRRTSWSKCEAILHRPDTSAARFVGQATQQRKAGTGKDRLPNHRRSRRDRRRAGRVHRSGGASRPSPAHRTDDRGRGAPGAGPPTPGDANSSAASSTSTELRRAGRRDRRADAPKTPSARRPPAETWQFIPTARARHGPFWTAREGPRRPGVDGLPHGLARHQAPGVLLRISAVRRRGRSRVRPRRWRP
jgi:hypothetical protein